MRIFKIYFLSLFLVLIWSGTVQAASSSAALQKRYDSLKSMRAEFSQVLLHKESGTKERRKGILLFQKPLLVRWETKSPAPELLLVTGKEIWNYFADEDVAYKYPLNLVEDSSNILRVITGQARLEQDFDVKNEGTENGLDKLHLFPKEPVQALVEALLWVDPDSGLIKKARIYDFYGNENEITFEKQEQDVAIPASSFEFTPPKGVDVEDRTQGGEMSKPLLN